MRNGMVKATGEKGRYTAPAGARAGAFTLIELMVSVSVMVLMALYAGSFMVQISKTINTSEATLTANANMRAAADRLRQDVSSVTQDGFLAIVTREVSTSVSGVTYRRLVPHLVLTSVGTYRSLLDGVFADSARIDYSLTNFGYKVDDRGTADANDDIVYSVLFRRAFLLDAGSPTANDHERMALEYYRANPQLVSGNVVLSPLVRHFLSTYMVPNRQYVFTYPDGSQETFLSMTTPPALTVPPLTLADVNTIWPYMIDEVAELKIEWTDGTRDASGKLNWYGQGPDPNVPARARNPQWTQVAAVQQDMLAAPLPEFNLNAAAGGGATPLYCALWTFKNKADWPKALRVEMLVGSPPQRHEVIVGLVR